jgi:hydroxymethylpyrimidine pyrophosphatase-like HAD family hydrolase
MLADMRESGVSFNMASSRPLFEQEELFQIITDNSEPQPLEGILYEASAVKLWYSEEKHQVGGLSYDQIDQIESFIIQHGLVTGMVPQQNNRKYNTQLGYVTPGFRNGEGTDKVLLENVYHKVKSEISHNFLFAQVEMSADAVDIMAKGVSKDKPTIKYSEITGINLSETAAIGDSGGDMAMLREISKHGGKVGYVGENKDHVKELLSYNGTLFKTEQFGPKGTIEFVKKVINYNNSFGG